MDDIQAFIDNHPSVKGWQPGDPPSMLRFFSFAHLPAGLREQSKEFACLAVAMQAQIDAKHVADPREAQVAMRKLLEAKDAMVRAMIGVKV